MEDKAVVIGVESSFSRIRVKINGITHLSLPQSPDLSVQTWLYTGRDYYAIEYYSCGVTILCEYASRGLWEEILRQLEELKII